MWVLLDEEDCPAKLYPEIPLTGLIKRGAGILGVKEINNSRLISLTFMQTQLSGSCKAMLFLTTKEPLRDLQTRAVAQAQSLSTCKADSTGLLSSMPSWATE